MGIVTVGSGDEMTTAPIGSGPVQVCPRAEETDARCAGGNDSIGAEGEAGAGYD